MDCDFINKDLIKLYTTGKSKKYRLPQNVIFNFVARIGEIEAASDIYDLWKKPSLNFEKLKGKKKGYCSVRVTGKWRLEFRVDWEDEKQTKGFCYITELSNHYGD